MLSRYVSPLVEVVCCLVISAQQERSCGVPLSVSLVVVIVSCLVISAR